MTTRDAGLEALVRKAWTDTLPAQSFDPARRWEDTGADSLLTLHLLLRLEKALGRRLSFDLVAPESTAADIARALLAGRDGAAGPAVFLVPGVFGDEPILADFRRAAGGAIRFELVDLPEAGAAEDLLTGMAQTGDYAARAIMRRQPEGEILLAGFSFGGAVAFEAARCLIAAGRGVAFLGVLDTAFDRHTLGEPDPLAPEAWSWALAGGVAKALARGDVAGARDRLCPVLGASRAGRRILLGAYGRLWPRELIALRRALLLGFRRQAIDGWRPGPLAVTGLLCATAEFAPRIVEGWRRLCPEMRVLVVPACHRDIFRAAPLAVLAPAFRDAVVAARTGSLRGACGFGQDDG